MIAEDNKCHENIKRIRRGKPRQSGENVTEVEYYIPNMISGIEMEIRIMVVQPTNLEEFSYAIITGWAYIFERMLVEYLRISAKA